MINQDQTPAGGSSAGKGLSNREKIGAAVIALLALALIIARS